jgi:hypothetical protein
MCDENFQRWLAWIYLKPADIQTCISRGYLPAVLDWQPAGRFHGVVFSPPDVQRWGAAISASSAGFATAGFRSPGLCDPFGAARPRVIWRVIDVGPTAAYTHSQ